MGGDVPSHIMEQIVLENIIGSFYCFKKEWCWGFWFLHKYNHFGVFGNKGTFFHSLETIGSSTLNLDRFWLFIQSIYSHVYPAVHWVHSFFLLGKLVILSPCQFGSISSNDHRVKKGRLSTLANLCFYYIGNMLAHISCNISTSEFVEFNHIFLINKLEKRNVPIECCRTHRL